MKMGTMSATERRELRNILKGKYELLETELRQRADDYNDDQIAKAQARFARKTKAAESATDAIQAKADALKEEARKVQDKLAGQGIRNAQTYYPLFDYTILADWVVTDLAEEIQAINKDTARRLQGALNELRAAQLGMQESISLDAIESESAKEFLSQMPSVDALLPAQKLRAVN